MASGILGSADLSAATNTTLYTAPVAKSPVVVVNLCNRNSSDVTVRIAIASADTPTNGEYIEYGVTVPANGVIERGGVVLSAGKKVVVYSSIAGVSANVWGYEE